VRERDPGPDRVVEPPAELRDRVVEQVRPAQRRRAVRAARGTDPAGVRHGGIVGAARRRALTELAALVAFAFVGSVSPGPNDAVLWASGMAFGFLRSVPHVLGTALGIAALVLGVAR
jgi:hypothetical protein